MNKAKIYNRRNLWYLKKLLAGDESAIRHTLLRDFLIVANKLEELGFVYYRGNVVIVKPQEQQNV